MRDLNTPLHGSHVDEFGGIHDQYCRCRDCKPPMAQVQAMARLKVALIGSGFLVGLLVAFQHGA